MITLPPLGYSSQYAAFNLIVLAVGHQLLQLLLFVVDVSQWRYITLLGQGFLAATLYTSWATESPKPDFGSDSISFGAGMHSQNRRKPLVR